MTVEINEGIRFSQFDSKSHGLYVLERDAPSPDEKEIVEDIPYMQGVHDFSMILGERIFDNREIRYVFKKYNAMYEQRKLIENRIKDEVMSVGQTDLFDTHDRGYHWYGKAKSVDVDDDQDYNWLKITIVFDCYPFLLRDAAYFDDIWDTFDFGKDVANFSRYRISGTKILTIINNGSTAVSPILVATNEMTITIDGANYIVPQGESENVFIKIARGINRIVVSGYGELTILMRTELMA